MWKNCGLLVLMLVTFGTFNFVGGTRNHHGFQKASGNSKGWLRVCNNIGSGDTSNVVGHYEVQAETCTHGAWLSESLEGGCICVNGIWAISQSLCDEDYFLAYGRGDCFKMDTPIRKLTFLGNPKNAFESTNLVTKENGHMFRTFSNMPYEFSHGTNFTILRLHPHRGTGVLLEVKQDSSWDNDYMKMNQLSNDVASNVQPLCLDTDFRNGWRKEALEIYKMKREIKQITITEQCSNNGQKDNYREKDVTIFKVLPGQAIHVKSGSILQATKNCSRSCIRGGSRSAKFAHKKVKLIRHKRQAQDDMLQLDREFTTEERDEITRTSTLHVVKQELNWLLEKILPPTLKTEYWKLAQKMKDIFIKACPDTEAPKFIAESMMRLFRLFYLNSRDFFPNGHFIEEKAQNDRMSSTLDLCLKAATSFEFKYEVVINSTSNCRMDADNQTSYCHCEKKLVGIDVPSGGNTTGPNKTSVTGEDLELPESLKFRLPKKDDTNSSNSSIHDFPTETMWKIVTFVHYYCAQYFEYNPSDFSALMTKMEDHFNEDIIYRWTRPGTSSFSMWQYLYYAYDLKKFAKSLDVCVAASKHSSSYPEWMDRPNLDAKRRRKRSLDIAKLWKGSAYCLDDPWDPMHKLGVAADDKCIDLSAY